MKRRKFIELSSAGALLLPRPILHFNSFSNADKLTFGLVADVHHGMIPDTQSRLEAFIEKAQEKKVDFIIQLGDFCHLEERSKSFLKVGTLL